MTRRLVAIPAAAAALLVSLSAGAGAQTRTVVVPAGDAVVVPPRGAALPRPVLRPVAQGRPRLPPIEPTGTDWRGAGGVAQVLLPAIAAAAVAAALSNGNGNPGNHTASGPVRTR